jgi:hypothetical protein
MIHPVVSYRVVIIGSEKHKDEIVQLDFLVTTKAIVLIIHYERNEAKRNVGHSQYRRG